MRKIINGLIWDINAEGVEMVLRDCYNEDGVDLYRTPSANWFLLFRQPSGQLLTPPTPICPISTDRAFDIMAEYVNIDDETLMKYFGRLPKMA